uniref:folate gamma-glutamyl hydrolase n=1 Tax=Clastoptera arizonana TaxID=38151 RepID=A0A1B6EFZ1_9HEMI
MIAAGLTSLYLTLTLTTATERPILGVLAQEFRLSRGKSFVPAAYVKAVEASGARVVPIFINRTFEYYQDTLNKINGVVLPGGGVNFVDHEGYADAGRIIYETAMKMNEEGDYFPIFGVCQGYQLLMFLANDNNCSIMSKCESFEALPLMFKPNFRNSSLFRDAPEIIINYLKTLQVTSNHHRFCVTEESLRNAKLDSTWRVMSVNSDPFNNTFISSSESSLYPFVGVQFHPEKNAYEWNINQTFNPHFPEAIESGRYFYDWIVKAARKNNHSYSSVEEEQDQLIYNYNPSYMGKRFGYIEQAYYFD